MKKLFVDAAPLVDIHLSGVGHATYHLVEELSRDAAFTAGHAIVPVAFAWNLDRLARWRFGPTVLPRAIPIPGRVLGRLNRHNLLPPMDLLLGRGAYLFQGKLFGSGEPRRLGTRCRVGRRERLPPIDAVRIEQRDQPGILGLQGSELFVIGVGGHML